jgi:sarcosine oxidase/L-pipecolate oxidase
VFNIDSGFYIFPPNPSGLVKCAIHGAGYLNPTPTQSSSASSVSVPRTKLTPGAEDGMIPLYMIGKLREGLAEIYPEMMKFDFTSTRLCWCVFRWKKAILSTADMMVIRYMDTITGDWLIDYHPDFDNLVLATGGSGETPLPPA